MILIKLKNSSPGSRHKSKIQKIYSPNGLKKWQKKNFKKSYGRSNFNGILSYSKIAPKFNKNLNILKKLYLTSKMCVFTNFINYYNNRTYVGLVKYSNGAYANIFLAHGVIPGFFFKSTNQITSRFQKFFLNDTVILYNLSRRHVFYNIFSSQKSKFLFSAASGTFSYILSKDFDKNYFVLKLPSGDKKLVYSGMFVTLGRNSNILHKNVIVGKAGDNIKNGHKQSVRGVAMNPVDHPHGGRTKTNSPEKTPWGKIAKNNK